ncbi:MFS transporter [Aerosakkonema funiforme]|uniref:MFS transporter n=2 Tax=Oscillatoriophycideae TaxID=1301283 RepID=A0A926VFK3_9CYAN|nr:MFS transporter [Aerosakkonema funiforme]MBD2181649.1 MFS transporter [Aerosakkonema funiforme FACHB-1375]
MVEILQSPDKESNELAQTPSASGKWGAMLGAGIGWFMFGLQLYLVNIALPVMVKALDTNFATIQWTLLSYVLMLTVMVLGAARLGDMYNKKWLYLGGVIMFTIGCLLCGLAPTVEFLIAFRALQGLGAVFISALPVAIVTEAFPQQERGWALGILNGVFTLGIALGPAIGGLLLALGNWRLIFLVNVPIGMIASLIVALFVPSFSSINIKQKLDWIGVFLMTLTLTCFALGMTRIQSFGLGDRTEQILLAVAAIGLICFLAVESRIQEPMLDLGMFRSLEFSFSLLLVWMVYIIIAAMDLIVPFFLELVKQYSPLQAGLLLTVLPLSSVLASFIAGTMSDRFGEHTIVTVALLLLILGCWATSTLDDKSTDLGFIVRLVPVQMGLGTFYASNSSAVMGTVKREQLGIASGLLSFWRTLGLTTGVALLGTLFSTSTISRANTAAKIDVTNAPVEALVEGVDVTFEFALGIAIAATIVGLFLWWRSVARE